MKAFITGATGFLGSKIVARLAARGDEVVALVREESSTEALEALGVELVRGGLDDVDGFASALKGCDVVYHVGARVVTHGEWDEFYATNVDATERLIDASVSAGVSRIVHVSSLGIFEIAGDGVSLGDDADYDHAPLLRGHYTRSKIQADRVACRAARSGAPVVVVRPGQIYGPGHPSEPVFLGRVKKFLRPSLLAVVSSPRYLVSVVYVDNAADAVVAAGTADGVEGGIFNVIDDPELDQRTYFRALGEARGDGLKVVYIPVGIFIPAVKAVDLLFRILKRRPWPVAHQLIRSGRSATYRTDAARETLGWTPEVSIPEGLRQSLRDAA